MCVWVRLHAGHLALPGGPSMCPGELLHPHVAHVLKRVHERQLLPALIAVSYVGIEELGFLIGEVVLSQARRVE